MIAYYSPKNQKASAIIEVKYGQGKAILSGVHFEYNAFLLDTNDPYLKNIIPDLKQTDQARKTLVKEILKQFVMQN